MTLARTLRLGLLVLSLGVGLVACGGPSSNEVLAAQEPVMRDLQLDDAERTARHVTRGGPDLGNGPQVEAYIGQTYQPNGIGVTDSSTDPRVQELIDQASQKALDAGWTINRDAQGWSGNLERADDAMKGWRIRIIQNTEGISIEIRAYDLAD